MITDTCTTLLAQLRSQWDYTTAGVLADAFAENDDPYNAALWYVLAEPHSDERRLAYAAECEPRDAARAEFVRVQVELAKMRTGPLGLPISEESPWLVHNPKYQDLRRRERDLLRDYNRDLLEPRPTGTFTWQHNSRYGWGVKESGQPSRDIEVKFTRGFVSHIICSAADWLTHGPAIRLCQPVVSVVLPSQEDAMLIDPEQWPGIRFFWGTDRPEEDELEPGHRPTRGG